ncbi:MAG: glutathione S-transferase [Deltaproteobacteria bacterium]|nr:glutathione S-transferase [Deltaproteobacteria bacterium]
MQNQEDSLYTIYGHIGSPYSMKMRAVMRYRRIPHVWKDGAVGMEHAKKQVKAPVIPVFKYPDGSFHNDSTPLIYDLEERHVNGRSIVPEREADAFLAFLIEDLADELLSKAMYHYRWFDERYVKQISEWIAFDMFEGSGKKNIEAFAEAFRERQMGRLSFVGSSEHNRPMLEHISNLFLDTLESHVSERWFMFGTRPSMAEFGLFGQLSQYHNDLAIIEHARQRAPYTFRWVLHTHDLSGFVGEWRPDTEPLPEVIEKLLQIAGKFYFPFLLANAKAFEAGEKEFSFEAGGMPYTQGVFKFQVKCLAALRQSYADLSESAQNELNEILQKTGCLDYLQAAVS